MDCLNFQGDYSERGELPGVPEAQPSLVDLMFGAPYPRGRHTTGRVRFGLSQNGVLEVTFWSDMNPLSTPMFSRRTSDFTCEAGRLVVHDRRVISFTPGAALEDITITFSATDDYLVAQTKVFAAGVLLIIVPVAGTSTSWYRFSRLSEQE